MAEERRLPIADERRKQISDSHRLPEDRAAPDLEGKRYRNGLGSDFHADTFAAVQPRRELFYFDPEAGEHGDALVRLSGVEPLDGERLVPLAETETHGLEKGLQPPAVVPAPAIDNAIDPPPGCTAVSAFCT